MKFAIVVLALVAAASAQYNPFSVNRYDPTNQYNRKQYNTPTYRPYVASTYKPFASSSTFAPPTPVSVVSKVLATDDRNAEVVRFGNEINPDGSYNYFYETSNGIAAQEQGTPRNFGGNPPVVPDVAQGSFSWRAPDGQTIEISYTADENGYQPSGNAIPTPPPIPAQIARALEYIARNAAQK